MPSRSARPAALLERQARSLDDLSLASTLADSTPADPFEQLPPDRLAVYEPERTTVDGRPSHAWFASTAEARGAKIVLRAVAHLPRVDEDSGQIVFDTDTVSEHDVDVDDAGEAQALAALWQRAAGEAVRRAEEHLTSLRVAHEEDVQRREQAERLTNRPGDPDPADAEPPAERIRFRDVAGFAGVCLAAVACVVAITALGFAGMKGAAKVLLPQAVTVPRAELAAATEASERRHAPAVRALVAQVDPHQLADAQETLREQTGRYATGANQLRLLAPSLDLPRRHDDAEIDSDIKTRAVDGIAWQTTVVISLRPDWHRDTVEVDGEVWDVGVDSRIVLTARGHHDQSIEVDCRASSPGVCPAAWERDGTQEHGDQAHRQGQGPTH